MIAEPEPQKTEIKRKKFNIYFFVMAFLSLVIYYLDPYISSTSMNASMKLSVYLQRESIYQLISWLDFAMFRGLMIGVVFVYLYSRDIVSSFSIVTMFCFSIWTVNVLQLLYAEGRPLFYSHELVENKKFCEYGKPNLSIFCMVSLFLWANNHFVQNYTLTPLKKYLFQATLVLIVMLQIYIILYMGSSAIHQIAMSLIFSGLYYLGHQKFENITLHYILLPILEKDKLLEKKAIIFILTLLVLMNYIMISCWCLNYTRFENLENEKLKFRGCIECLAELDMYFSTKMVTFGFIFNVIFGMFLGVYTQPSKVFEFERYVADGRPRLMIYRLMFSLLFMLPVMFIEYPRFRNPYAAILKSIFSALFVGFLLTNALMRIMKQVVEAKSEFANLPFMSVMKPEESRVTLSIHPEGENKDFYV